MIPLDIKKQIEKEGNTLELAGFIIDKKYEGKKIVNLVKMHELIFERARKKGYHFIFATSISKKSYSYATKLGLKLIVDLDPKNIEFKGKKPLSQASDEVFFGYLWKEI